MQPPTQDTPETRVIPSPAKEATNDAKALVTARIIHASNPQAFHRYAETELSAWTHTINPTFTAAITTAREAYEATFAKPPPAAQNAIPPMPPPIT